jgi:hypothetical protein
MSEAVRITEILGEAIKADIIDLKEALAIQTAVFDFRVTKDTEYRYGWVRNQDIEDLKRPARSEEN